MMYKSVFAFCLLSLMMMDELKSQATVSDAEIILRGIHARKSVRSYSSQVVEEATVLQLLQAAMAAPSARNVQPWRFYVITRPALLQELAEGLPYAKMLHEAPLAIVVAGDTRQGNPNAEQQLNWTLDCAAATQNLLLAAGALGLGAVWTGVYPYAERIRVVQQALDLPEHIVPLNVIPIGYPAGQEMPKNKWDPEKIQWLK